MVVLGAGGDLMARYLLPALGRLLQLERLPPGFSVLGISQEPASDEAFRERMAEQLARHAPDLHAPVRQDLVARLTYRQADVTDAGQVARALPGVNEPLLVYLALPPAVYAGSINALCDAGLAAGSRLVIEKPFGWDLASARDLNRLIAERLGEAAVFRIDHFLGMQTVQNILGLRFANRIFESLWNAVHVERVEIVWDETLTLEGRAGYYDAAGALLDMIQNHLLQLLCLVAMEPPQTLSERDLRDRKVDVLRAVRRLGPEEVDRQTRRARYGAGRIGERRVPAYTGEPGVDPQRGTETFAEVMLFVGNWRWAGVPFILRSGKALERDRREIAVHFRPVPHLAFEEEAAYPNILRLNLEPERLALAFNITGPGERFDLRETVLESPLNTTAPDAYSRLLLDALQGDSTLAIRGDEAEEAWQIIEPITRAWKAGHASIDEYPAGSRGPTIPLRGVAPG
ncbi:glucose-6-phosphate 1-dehydrogenase [Thiohalomonas denitrificans]|uniref:Glucose-6-phosphate 1-dehydrogenase n=2 Tax=Thiohalomonas denitrificans TaxID=415747 RepID=A0A1G5Q9K5_9GAMM|nr:glucose-6-phosphate 1-dehydrogenase [Thiohalomonas denitrificans]